MLRHLFIAYIASVFRLLMNGMDYANSYEAFLTIIHLQRYANPIKEQRNRTLTLVTGVPKIRSLLL